ncbi:hypothetical protein GCM10010918_38880 [Paenibacillus radicis (ex Gao et al. 2016)]|uniref:DUF418 domain-containing protein n=1 Tax=Paenibacillus radicis (ex Gao et al. 2016) TaxID=1737354 RepID=A0A917HHG2_9BACL|nr:hypothetical protein GCM10010918_38880 [Paenibacillus radicis (ex Gao et al. 2016)]
MLGILLANMFCFQYGMWGMQEMSFFSLSAADSAAHTIVKIVVETSFMPIFAFLFGFGMVKIKENVERRHGLAGQPIAHLARRFTFLIVIGLVHYIFLWEGDVLISYGLTGFGMLLFLRAKPRTLFIWGLVFAVLAALLSYGAHNDAVLPLSALEKFNEKTIAIYGSGSFAEIIQHRTLADPLGMYGFYQVLNLFISPIVVAPMFLFGMSAAKLQLFHRPEQEKKHYIMLAAVLIPAGLLLKSAKYLLPDLGWAGSIAALGGTILALGYLSGLALLFSARPGWLSGWMNRFESVGRLSMSNYLLQTIVCVFVFYGFGLGLFTKIGILGGIALAFAIFIVQCFASQLYLRYFKIGPIERVLRAWTALRWKRVETEIGKGANTGL